LLTCYIGLVTGAIRTGAPQDFLNTNMGDTFKQLGLQ